MSFVPTMRQFYHMMDFQAASASALLAAMPVSVLRLTPIALPRWPLGLAAVAVVAAHSSMTSCARRLAAISQ